MRVSGGINNTDLVPLQEKYVLQLPFGKLLFFLNMSFFQLPKCRLPRSKKLKHRNLETQQLVN